MVLSVTSHLAPKLFRPGFLKQGVLQHKDYYLFPAILVAAPTV